MAKVSILVPSYNHAKFLPRCIESVLEQTLGDWELIVVDDVSSDNSLEIARSYIDPRIKVYENTVNLGTYRTENRCLELASGEFVAILNSDDHWMPTKLEKQVALLEANPECSFSYCRGMITEHGEEISSDVQHGQMPTSPVQDLRPWLIVDNRVMASSLVFRRGAASFNESLRYSGDWAIVLKLCQQGLAAFVNEDLTVWRFHSGNAHKERVKHFSEEMRVREAILDKPDRWKLPGTDAKKVNEGLVWCALHLHSIYILVGEREKAKQLLQQALELDPENTQVRKRLKYAWLPLPIQRRRLSPGVNAAEYLAAYPSVDRTPLSIEP